MELDEHECMPRLLDIDSPLPLERQRWFGRYLHSWRRRLFGMWQSEDRQGVNELVLGQSVDEIIGTALLLEYLRRLGHGHLPTLADFCKGQLPPTIGGRPSCLPPKKT